MNLAEVSKLTRRTAEAIRTYEKADGLLRSVLGRHPSRGEVALTLAALNSMIFKSSAANLTAGVASSGGNLYARNLLAGTTTLLTPNTAGTDGGNGDIYGIPAVSADGQVIALGNTSSNLVTNDDNGARDVFVRDVKAGTTAVGSATPPTPTTPRATWRPPRPPA